MNTFQTLDELILHYSTSVYYSDNWVANKSSTIYEYILLHELFKVIKIIRSKTNLPSVHDLMLVSTINKINGDIAKRWIDPTTEYWIKTTKEILQIYKDRKKPSNENKV